MLQQKEKKQTSRCKLKIARDFRRAIVFTLSIYYYWFSCVTFVYLDELYLERRLHQCGQWLAAGSVNWVEQWKHKSLCFFLTPKRPTHK